MQWHERIKGRVKLRQLHTLEAVAHSGSMAKAAGYLGLSQSAVSKSITETERTLGVPLLERTARGVEPTAYARILLKRSVRSLTSWARASRKSNISPIPPAGS
jgi:DNA-binding transcriptional LysR family regulator